MTNIKNSKAVLNGTMTPDKLGVKAVDSANLDIQLEASDQGFLKLLATSPAMPCNEAFFYSTKGKYGLNPESTSSDGPFYFSKWNPQAQSNQQAVLVKNDYYPSATGVLSKITLAVNTDSDTYVSKFLGGKTHAVIFSADNYKEVSSKGRSVKSFQNRVWNYL
jgi:oligopeptide transport system substrate-binding protein